MPQENEVEQEAIEAAKKEAARVGYQVHDVLQVEDNTPPPRKFTGMNGQTIFADRWGRWSVTLRVINREDKEADLMLSVEQSNFGFFARVQQEVRY